MSASNRAAKFTKMHKVLKKHYEPVLPLADRTVLEHLLYACCLENVSYEQADEAFARLQESYFDWNEVRVTTVKELAECMKGLPDETEAATRLKRTLHAVFETHYAYDLEMLKKENLGKAILQLKAYRGITPFVVAYVAQAGLSGHSIGVDQALMNLMVILDVVTEKEAKKGGIPGMERAIPKAKGVEFFSLAHQLAAALRATPHGLGPRAIVLEIDAKAKDRLAKKGVKKKPAASESKPVKKKKVVVAEKKPPVKKKSVATKKVPPKKVTPKKGATKKSAASTKTAKKKSPAKTLAKKKPR